MTFSRIAVGLDGSPHAETALSHSLRIARATGALVRGIHVVDRSMLDGVIVADLSGSVGFQPFLNLSGELHDALVSAGGAILAAFEDRAKEAGVAFEPVLREGNVSQILEEEAQMSDLAAVGSRGANAAHRRDLVGRHADAMARRMPAPLLVAPEEYRDFEQPLLAWDGSPKSRKALVLAAELAALFELPVRVVVASNDAEEGHALLAEAEEELRYRHVKVSSVLRADHPDDAIFAEIAAGADLVAMGAHGHGRVVELVLGSTTDRVLRAATVPVLLAS
ncbi:MAG TPA: universal stress protein [Thermoanaerobaculia bacterium]|nr:universal stress protein [Thermoanaerobaculia bacterium]